MAKTIVCGDTHLKHDKYYTQAIEMFFDWLSEQPFNIPENTFLHVGDFYDKYSPTPKDIARGIYFLQDKLKFEKKYILTGNYKHSFDGIKKIWAEDSLEPVKSVEVIKMIKGLKIGNLNCLILPWFNRITHPEGLSTKQYYENLPNQYREKEYDFIFGHITNKDLFGEIVDISYLKAKKIVLGHVHNCNFSPDFIGTPLVCRKDEQGKKNRIMIIDNDTGEFEYLEVPRFIEYVDITYPNKPEPSNISIQIFDIHEAPSIEIVKEHYKDLIIRRNGIHRKKVEREVNGEVIKSDTLTIKDYLNNFMAEKELSERQREILIERVG